MKVNISYCLERLWVKVEDSLGDECVMLLKRHELQELKVAIEKWQQKQPFRVAKEATGHANKK